MVQHTEADLASENVVHKGVVMSTIRKGQSQWPRTVVLSGLFTIDFEAFLWSGLNILRAWPAFLVTRMTLGDPRLWHSDAESCERYGFD